MIQILDAIVKSLIFTIGVPQIYSRAPPNLYRAPPPFRCLLPPMLGSSYDYHERNHYH